MTENHEDEALISINITPFTDVVLVLLIIFMVAAPQIRKEALDIKLPKASVKDSAAARDGAKICEVVLINTSQLYFDGATLEIEVFEKYLKERAADCSSKIFAVSADSGISYQKVVTVLDIMRRNNCENVILRTEY